MGLCALGALGLFVSTLTEQSTGVTIATIMLSAVAYVVAVLSAAWARFGARDVTS